MKTTMTDLEKVQARTKRNYRTVEAVFTADGFDFEIYGHQRNREKALLSTMKFTKRRKGEKIVGTPRCYQTGTRWSRGEWFHVSLRLQELQRRLMRALAAEFTNSYWVEQPEYLIKEIKYIYQQECQWSKQRRSELKVLPLP